MKIKQSKYTDEDCEKVGNVILESIKDNHPDKYSLMMIARVTPYAIGYQYLDKYDEQKADQKLKAEHQEIMKLAGVI
jgi:hypothetical protein